MSIILSRSLCLVSGRYRLAMPSVVCRDAFGDGIAAPGYCVAALDGEAIAGSSGFGAEEETRFAVVTKPLFASVEVHEGSEGGSLVKGSSADATPGRNHSNRPADLKGGF